MCVVLVFLVEEMTRIVDVVLFLEVLLELDGI